LDVHRVVHVGDACCCCCLIIIIIIVCVA
jgi:hypothetical protein